MGAQAASNIRKRPALTSIFRTWVDIKTSVSTGTGNVTQCLEFGDTLEQKSDTCKLASVITNV